MHLWFKLTFAYLKFIRAFSIFYTKNKVKRNIASHIYTHIKSNQSICSIVVFVVLLQLKGKLRFVSAFQSTIHPLSLFPLFYFII